VVAILTALASDNRLRLPSRQTLKPERDPQRGGAMQPDGSNKTVVVRGRVVKPESPQCRSSLEDRPRCRVRERSALFPVPSQASQLDSRVDPCGHSSFGAASLQVSEF
jgi:hypothetical protein